MLYELYYLNGILKTEFYVRLTKQFECFFELNLHTFCQKVGEQEQNTVVFIVK